MNKWGVLALAAALAWPSVGAEVALAKDVRPKVQAAEREMKRYKNEEKNPIYARAHELIYGKGGAMEQSMRPRIAVVINGDENLVVEDDVKDVIYSMLRQKFPREYFALMKGTDVNTRLLQYAEDLHYDTRETATVVRGNHLDNQRASERLFGWRNHDHGQNETVQKPSKVDVDGMPVGIRPRGLSDMRCQDFVRAGRDFNYDYVFVITLSEGVSHSFSHNYLVFSQKTNIQNIWLRVRFVDVPGGKYVYRNDVAAKGKAHNGYNGRRTLRRGVEAAMTEVLADIDIDTGVGR